MSRAKTAGWSAARAMAAFAERLRAAGLAVGAGEVQAALRALEVLGVAPVARIRAALAAVLVRDIADRPVFDAVFEQFWLDPIAAPGVEVPSEEPPAEAGERRIDSAAGYRYRATRQEAVEHAARPDEARGAAARGPAPSADYAAVSPAEQARLRELARRAARRLARARLRRQVGGGHQTIDWPATLRVSLRHGGELIRFPRRRAVHRRLRLLVLVDVSHSMRQYSELSVAFVRALAGCCHGVDIARFADRAVDAPGAAGGGTRIGESLAEALARPGRRVDRHTVVLIVSDGWDAGSRATLEHELARLAKRAAALYWLDPLLAHPGYFESAAGVHHDSPYVDRILAARSVVTLAAGLRDLPAFRG